MQQQISFFKQFKHSNHGFSFVHALFNSLHDVIMLSGTINTLAFRDHHMTIFFQKLHHIYKISFQPFQVGIFFQLM